MIEWAGLVSNYMSRRVSARRRECANDEHVREALAQSLSTLVTLLTSL
jgi:hypothetical protein